MGGDYRRGLRRHRTCPQRRLDKRVRAGKVPAAFVMSRDAPSLRLEHLKRLLDVSLAVLSLFSPQLKHQEKNVAKGNNFVLAMPNRDQELASFVLWHFNTTFGPQES